MCVDRSQGTYEYVLFPFWIENIHLFLMHDHQYHSIWNTMWPAENSDINSALYSYWINIWIKNCMYKLLIKLLITNY